MIKTLYPKLVETLERNGYNIREDSGIIFEAKKEYKTFLGMRECTICVFKGDKNRVYPNYFSEGRNILEANSFPIIEDAQKYLDECEKKINESYAVRLLKK